jgi:hypothetical protein
MALTSEALIRKMLDLFGARKTYLLTGMMTPPEMKEGTTGSSTSPPSPTSAVTVDDRTTRTTTTPENSTATTTKETLVAVPCAQIHLDAKPLLRDPASTGVNFGKPVPVEIVPFTAERTLALVGKMFDELPGPGNYVVVEHGMVTMKAPWPPPSSAPTVQQCAAGAHPASRLAAACGRRGGTQHRPSVRAAEGGARVRHGTYRHGRRRRAARDAYRGQRRYLRQPQGHPQTAASSTVTMPVDGTRPRGLPPQPPPESHLLWPSGPGPGVIRRNASEDVSNLDVTLHSHCHLSVLEERAVTYLLSIARSLGRRRLLYPDYLHHESQDLRAGYIVQIAGPFASAAAACSPASLSMSPRC